jgi:hypothetical protein
MTPALDNVIKRTLTAGYNNKNKTVAGRQKASNNNKNRGSVGHFECWHAVKRYP